MFITSSRAAHQLIGQGEENGDGLSESGVGRMTPHVYDVTRYYVTPTQALQVGGTDSQRLAPSWWKQNVVTVQILKIVSFSYKSK